MTIYRFPTRTRNCAVCGNPIPTNSDWGVCTGCSATGANSLDSAERAYLLELLHHMERSDRKQLLDFARELLDAEPFDYHEFESRP